MNLLPLRMVLLFDSAFLFWMGAAFIVAPGHCLSLFHFSESSPQVKFLVSMWGCALGTLSLGYFQAVANPLANRSWLQVGIARGVLEVLVVGLAWGRGQITWQQGGLGLMMGLLIASVYSLCYPRGVDRG